MQHSHHDAKLKALKLALANMARYYGQDVSVNQLQVWAAHLQDLEIELVAAAMSELMNDPKRFRAPLPAEIRARIEGPTSDEGLAVEAAGRVWAAISRRGYYWDHEPDFQAQMLEDLGSLGVELVRGWGGWRALVIESNDAEPGIMRAQLRERAKALCDQARKGRLRSAPMLPETSAARALPLTALSEILPRLSGPAEPSSTREPNATGKGGPKR